MRTIAVLLACTLACGCMEWKVASLEPQTFTPDSSPARVRVTMRDGAQVTARRPVILRDSLVWTGMAVPLSSIQLVEVHRYNPTAVVIVAALSVGAFTWFMTWVRSVP